MVEGEKRLPKAVLPSPHTHMVVCTLQHYSSIVWWNFLLFFLKKKNLSIFSRRGILGLISVSVHFKLIYVYIVRLLIIL